MIIGALFCHLMSWHQDIRDFVTCDDDWKTLPFLSWIFMFILTYIALSFKCQLAIIPWLFISKEYICGTFINSHELGRPFGLAICNVELWSCLREGHNKEYFLQHLQQCSLAGVRGTVQPYCSSFCLCSEHTISNKGIDEIKMVCTFQQFLNLSQAFIWLMILNKSL